MIARRLTTELDSALAESPAVALLGPRQVGKTTLEPAPTRPAVYLDLESEADRTKLDEPELYLAEHADKLVILDEIQRTPQLFQSLRGLWTMLAHSQGGLRNAAALARALAVDGKTVASYLNLLVDLLLVRRLAPWRGNVRKRPANRTGIPCRLRDRGTGTPLGGVRRRGALSDRYRDRDHRAGRAVRGACSGVSPFAFREHEWTRVRSGVMGRPACPRYKPIGIA